MAGWNEQTTLAEPHLSPHPNRDFGPAVGRVRWANRGAARAHYDHDLAVFGDAPLNRRHVSWTSPPRAQMIPAPQSET